MKRIAFVFPDLLPMPAVRGGASETLIQRLIDDNEKYKKCIFHVYCKYDPEALKQSQKYQYTKFVYIREKATVFEKIKFQLFRVRRRLSRSYVPEQYLVQLTNALCKEEYDSIIIESVFWFAPYIKRNVCAPLLLHLHFDAVGMNHPDMKKSLDACDGVICVSCFIESSIKRFSPETATCVLDNVTDVDLFDRNLSLKQAKELRTQWGIGADNIVVMYAGRLMQVKGVMELVKAFQLAKENNPNLRLVLVGSAEYGRTVEDTFYAQLVEQIGGDLGQCVHMTGYIPHEQMPGYYAMADIAVMPTIGVEEASGLSALEPLAAGCRFIGSDSGGIPEVACSECAVIVPRGESFVDNLAQSITRCAEKSRNELPTSGQLHVRKNHNAQDYYKHFLKCLQEIS